MGCFSWDCIVCRRSLRGAKASRRRPGEAWASDVVLVPERGEPMAGEYDGYGRVAGVPMPESWGTMESDELRFDIERSRQQLPEADGTDAAHPAWWRGQDAGCKGSLALVRRLRVEVDALKGEANITRDEVCALAAGVGVPEGDPVVMARGMANRIATLRAVVAAVRREHDARAAWLASLPSGACSSPPPQALLDAEAATRAALQGVP